MPCNALKQVWVVNLALYSLHIGGSSRVGEPWSSPESWVQLAGFVLLLAGTIIYAQVLGYTCRVYSHAVELMNPEPGPGPFCLAKSCQCNWPFAVAFTRPC